ncbi:unnamed protein product, partial [Meganyctiphanes norvegica]
TCSQPDYPDVPAICCNIPGAPVQPPHLDVCPFQSQCVPEGQCHGTILDNTFNMVPYAAGGSWSTCGNPNIPGVCCINPPINKAPSASPPASHVPVDLCQPNPCGTNAECTVRGQHPVCSCPNGHVGNPLTNCRRGESI